MGLFRRNENSKKPVIRHILDIVPRWIFDSCTSTYQTDKGCSKYRTYDLLVALTFGQLSYIAMPAHALLGRVPFSKGRG